MQPIEIKPPCTHGTFSLRHGESMINCTHHSVVLAADRASIAAVATNADDRERATVDTEQSVDVGEDDAQKAQEGIASSGLSLWCNHLDSAEEKLRLGYVRW